MKYYNDFFKSGWRRAISTGADGNFVPRPRYFLGPSICIFSLISMRDQKCLYETALAAVVAYAAVTVQASIYPGKGSNSNGKDTEQMEEGKQKQNEGIFHRDVQ